MIFVFYYIFEKIYYFLLYFTSHHFNYKNNKNTIYSVLGILYNTIYCVSTVFEKSKNSKKITNQTTELCFLYTALLPGILTLLHTSFNILFQLSSFQGVPHTHQQSAPKESEEKGTDVFLFLLSINFLLLNFVSNTLNIISLFPRFYLDFSCQLLWGSPTNKKLLTYIFFVIK